MTWSLSSVLPLLRDHSYFVSDLSYFPRPMSSSLAWDLQNSAPPPFLNGYVSASLQPAGKVRRPFSEAWRGRVHTNLLRNDTLPEWNLTLNELTFSSFPEDWLSPESGQGCLGPCLMLCSLPKLGEDLSNHRCNPVPTKSTRWARILLEASMAMPTFL